ncbi:MAG: EAL domain-containing protein [Betaproteobacteria bacterium]|nr:EAL domain-containing protein [Betaproteobacteria bacterium]
MAFRNPNLDLGRMLETLVNNLDGVVLRCRLDEHWTVLFISCGCQRLTGYAAEDLVGNKRISFERLTHPLDREQVRQSIVAAARAHGYYRVEYRIRRADGEIRWVYERGRVVVAEDGENVLEAFIEDIGDQVDARDNLALAEARYRSIFENSGDGIFQTTADGHYLDANPALAAIYGYGSPAELMVDLKDIGSQLYVDPDQRGRFKRVMAERGAVQDFESEIRQRDGAVIWITENAHSVYGPDGAFLYYEGTVRDITERKRYQQQLEFHANHDQLTGLPNRNLLNDRLLQAIHHAHRNSYFSVVAFIDLDNFKFINDSMGHRAGDTLLIEVAKRLQSCLRETDTVARYGGDEFVLILNDYYQVSQIVRVLERVLDEIGRPVTVLGQELYVTCSIGISQYPTDGEDPQSLLQHADAAMYLAKERGKNNFQFYTNRLNALATQRVKLESSLRRALDCHEIEVYFQPKVDQSGACIGVEALARWHSMEFGWVAPSQFIGIAEDSALIEPLTEYILRRACQQIADLLEQGGGIGVAVNLSARAFHQKDLARMIARVLAETRLPAHLLELEITESAMVGDIEKCIATLHELKAIGLRIAIDDFGTGYSSLSYLQRFPIDTLKIDRSFVSNMRLDPKDSPIAQAIISLGQSLRLTVVAEGVETAEQFSALKTLGCETFQGFLFAKPMPAEQFAAYYLAGSEREAVGRAME